MQKKSFSWGIIILMMFLFFPVAIYMIVKKMSSEKFNMIKNGKSLKILGWVLIGFAIIYLILGLTGELKNEDGSSIAGTLIVIELIFGVSGVLSLVKGKKYIKCGEKYNRYVSVVNASNDLLIDNIAAAIPTTYEKAAADLQAMIDAGYFMNAYVDLNRRELVMHRNQQSNYTNTYTVNPQNTGAKTMSKKCPNCGATNTVIEGTACECEYCGSPL